MPEYVTLDSAIRVDPGASVFRVAVFTIESHPNSKITIGLQEFDSGSETFIVGGKHITATIQDAGATALMRQLNTLDFSSISLEKRLISWCQANGHLGTGAVGGTPDAP